MVYNCTNWDASIWKVWYNGDIGKQLFVCISLRVLSKCQKTRTRCGQNCKSKKSDVKTEMVLRLLVYVKEFLNRDKISTSIAPPHIYIYAHIFFSCFHSAERKEMKFSAAGKILLVEHANGVLKRSLPSQGEICHECTFKRKTGRRNRKWGKQKYDKVPHF